MKIIKEIYNGFLRLDQIGPTPIITTGGDSRFRTFIGTLLTIGIYILVLYLKFQDFEDVVTSVNPKIQSSRTFINSTIIFNQTVSKLFFFEVKYFDLFTLSFKIVSYIDHPKFIVGRAFSNEQGFNISFIQNGLQNISYLESCINNQIFDNYSNNTEDPSNYPKEKIKEKQKNALCFPNHVNELLFSSPDNTKSIFVNIDYKSMQRLYKIYNSTLLMISINALDVNLEPDKSENPFKLFWKEDLIPINPNTTKAINVEIESFTGKKDRTKFIFKPEDPNTDHYFVNKLKVYMEFENLHNYPPEQESTLDSTMYLRFMNNQRITETELSYKTIDGVLGDIGGLISFLLPFIEIIFCYGIDPYYQTYRLNEVFKFHENFLGKEEIDDYQKKLMMENFVEEKINISMNDNDRFIKINNKNLTVQQNQSQQLMSNSNFHNNSNEIPLESLDNDGSSRKFDIRDKREQPKIERLRLNVENSHSQEQPEIIPSFSVTQREKMKSILTDVFKTLSRKRELSISCIDIYKAKFCQSEKDIKSKIFLKSLKFLESSLEENMIANQSIKIQLLNNMLLNKRQEDLFKIPSININVEENRLLIGNDEEFESEKNESKSDADRINELEQVYTFRNASRIDKILFKNYINSYL